MVKPVREITGRPGQSWGYIVIPARGKVTMRIAGDVLETKVKTVYGLENKEIYTRIQRIETVETVEGRLWWLLSVGIFLLPVYFLGVVPIVLFFFLKQKRLVVHDKSGSHIVFYKDSTIAKNFGQTLMIVARQLNSKSTLAHSKQPNKQQKPQRKSNGRPPSNNQFTAYG